MIDIIFFFKTKNRKKMNELFDKVSGDIKTAMLARDKVALETLRGIKKEFIEAKTAKGGDGNLADDVAVAGVVALLALHQTQQGAAAPGAVVVAGAQAGLQRGDLRQGFVGAVVLAVGPGQGAVGLPEAAQGVADVSLGAVGGGVHVEGVGGEHVDLADLDEVVVLGVEH